MKAWWSHGSGEFSRESFLSIGAGVVFEPGVLVFHPETISIGENVYIGHRAILKGHPHGRLSIADGTWVGQDVFIHSAGGVRIGCAVGIGPRVTILTSSHETGDRSRPILHAPLTFKPVTIEDEADIGAGAVILPGVTVGKGAQVGAGAVVTSDVEPYSIAAGNPARKLGMR